MSVAARRAALLLLSPLGILGACSDGEDGKIEDTSTATDDTGDDTGEDTSLAPGCVLVDGAGGYASVMDALSVASEGSTITLCEGSFEEAITVDKAVTIEGAGVEATTVSAPTNQAPFTITAAGVTLRSMALESTRSGVVVQADDATLSELAFLAVSNYGVTAKDASNLTIDACTFNATAYGGVAVDGGSATIQGSTFVDNVGFGIHGTGDADLIVTGNTISDTQPTDPEAFGDGHGVWAEEANLTLSDNVLTNNAFVGVFADTGDLSMSGDSITGSLYGVAAILGAVEVDGVTATDNYFHGVFAVTTSTDLTVKNTTITGDPEAVVDIETASWGADSVGYLGVGLYLVGPSPVVESTSVDGYNNAGLLLSPYDDAGCAASLTDVTLSNNGRVGLYALSADIAAENLNVTGVVEVEDAADSQCYSVGGNAAVSVIQGSLDMTGGSIEDNDGYGLASVYSVASVDGVSVAGNSCAGLMNFGGALVAQNSTFSRSHGGSFEAGVVSYQGSSATLVDNSFEGSQEWVLMYSSESDDGAGTIYRYDQYQYEGADIQLFYGGDNIVQDNVFTNGTDSVYAYDADVTVESNTWSDYRGVVLYVGSSTGTTMKVKDVDVEGYYSYGLYCSSATMDVSDARFTQGGSYMYTLEAYRNDEPYYTSSSTYANPLMYGYGCAATLEDVEVEEAEGSLLRAYGGTYDLASVYADNISAKDYTSYAAIYTYGYLDTEVWLTDVSLTNVLAGNGVNMYAYSDLDIALHVDGLTLENISGTGLYLYRSSTSYAPIAADIEDLEVSNTNTGLYLLGADLTMANSSVVDTSGEAIVLNQSTFVGEGVEISGAGEEGVLSTSSELTLSDSTISGNAGSGLYLGSTTVNAVGNTISGNGRYGMECSGATIETCGNDLSGNALGAQLSCDTSCETPPE